MKTGGGMPERLSFLFPSDFIPRTALDFFIIIKTIDRSCVCISPFYFLGWASSVWFETFISLSLPFYSFLLVGGFCYIDIARFFLKIYALSDLLNMNDWVYTLDWIFRFPSRFFPILIDEIRTRFSFFITTSLPAIKRKRKKKRVFPWPTDTHNIRTFQQR